MTNTNQLVVDSIAKIKDIGVAFEGDFSEENGKIMPNYPTAVGTANF